MIKFHRIIPHENGFYAIDRNGDIWEHWREGDESAHWRQIPGPRNITQSQRERLMVAVRRMQLGGLDEAEKRANRLTWLSRIIGRDIATTNDLTYEEARTAISTAEDGGEK
jgi:hypothetical protein